MKFWLILAAVLVSGCGLVGKRPVIKAGNASVVGLPDGTGTTLSQGETKSGVIIPANTPVEIVRHEAVPATPTTPFRPAREEIRFIPTFDTKLESVSTQLSANSGAVDTTVALRRIDVAERRWLLFTAIGCAILGFVGRIYFPAWPAIPNGLLLAAAAAGLAWKLSDIPAWLWAAVIGVALLLVLGYKRREKDELVEKTAVQKENPLQS